MSHDRRMLSRRRRVISAQLQSPDVPKKRSPTSSPSEESTRAGMAYGARVHRRLRARWFELVPVRRRSLLAVKLSLLSAVAVLVAGHWLSMHWPTIANSPELARPLRLDHPASFGVWFGALAISISAGVSFLIYQLRRYRADDYHGQYRIWRPVIVMLLILSVDSIAGLVDWIGAVFDYILAGRAPMAGNDWLRLLLCISGFGLTIRLLIEMWRAPVAAMWILVGALSVSSPMLIRWRLVDFSTSSAAMVAGAGPLLGRVAIFLSLLTYLRTIHREARGLNAIAGSKGRLRLPRFGAGRESSVQEQADCQPKPQRKQNTKRSSAKVASEPEPDQDFGSESETDSVQKRRGWFSRKRDTAADQGAEPDSDQDAESESETDGPQKRRGWFSRKRNAAADQGDEPDSEQDSRSEAESDAPQKRRGWFSRKRDTAEAPSDAASDARHLDERVDYDDEDSFDDETYSDQDDRRDREQSTQRHANTRVDQPASVGSTERSPQSSSDDSSLDVDNIDWDSMSKAERRRMKKLLRRQGNDAA